MRFSKLFLVLILLLLMVIGVACGASEEEQTGGVEQNEENSAEGAQDKSGESEDGTEFNLVSEGELTFAASGEFKPFSYLEDGEMVGFDIAVGEAIAEKLGLESVKIKAKYDGIIMGVQNKRYDIAVASHTITEERKENVNFTQPYYYAGTQIFTRPDSDIENPEDLTDMEIAVSKGSTFKNVAMEYTSDSNIIEYDSDVMALQALSQGRHDAVITNNITGLKIINDGADLIGKAYLEVNKAGVAVSKENEELLDAVKDALEELQTSGEIKALAEEWVGANITEEPEIDTAE
ncbi:transporter substrate-binding domain-containing protein [Virgibacillus sp. W0181]|uniref:transporter substrate-binding domain-containing protein n=1 Tax=Virgibacillus sp. W0181 TaxID=3391581 RepID=UPI003F47E7F5